MSDCIFCKIITGEIPSTCLYEDEFVFVFRDIYPQAPVHFLVVPKEHIVSAADITAENSHLVAKCFEVVSAVAKSEGLGNGFRVITNSGSDGKQSVFHLHFHVLGGKELDVSLV